MKKLNLTFCTLFLALGIYSANAQSVSASEVIQAAKDGKNVAYENVKIKGIVDFTPYQEKKDDLPGSSWFGIDDNKIENDISGKITFINCTFEDDVLAYYHDEDSEYTFVSNFDQEVIFKNCNFNKGAAFKYSKFDSYVDFSGSKIKDEANFKYAEFNTPANFSTMNFGDLANFKYAEFDNEVTFSGTKYDGEANYKYAEFDQMVNFSNVSFNNEANFKYTEVNDGINLSNTYFDGFLNLKYTKLNGEVNLKNFKVNGEMDTKYTEINGSDFNTYLVNNR